MVYNQYAQSVRSLSASIMSHQKESDSAVKSASDPTSESILTGSNLREKGGIVLPIDNHVRCEECRAVFPRVWVKSPRIAIAQDGLFWCSRKCKNVFDVKQANVFSRLTNPFLTPMTQGCWD